MKGNTMSIFNEKYQLKGREELAIDEIMDGIFPIFKKHKVPFAGDDRCAKVEEALAVAVVDSRKQMEME